MTDDELPSIDPAQLATVTGGATSTDASQQVQQMLQSLMTSIKDLAAARNNSGGGFMQMLPLLMMMRGHGGGGGPASAPVSYPETVVGPDGLTYNKAR